MNFAGCKGADRTTGKTDDDMQEEITQGQGVQQAEACQRLFQEDKGRRDVPSRMSVSGQGVGRNSKPV